MRHHTKDKGDTGLGFVIADLLSKGIQVAMPLSEHLPFDCIAISADNMLCRLSVKYRLAARGFIEVRLASSWADRHGSHTRKHDRATYDAVAIYSPSTSACYYWRIEEIKGETIWMNLKLNWDRYRNPERLWARGATDSATLF